MRGMLGWLARWLPGRSTPERQSKQEQAAVETSSFQRAVIGAYETLGSVREKPGARERALAEEIEEAKQLEKE